MEERIQKIIATAGIASRRAAEELISEGRVKVNGAVVTELGSKADPDKDHIKVDGKLINPRQPMTYVMLNKPVGYVTTMSDPEGRPVVSDLLKGVRTRVYPVGRLDYNTEGLLLLTNDGDFAHLVTHPRHELPKTYLVKIKGVLEDRDIENLERGVFLKDGRTAPAQVRRLRKEEANSWVEITIHEGRKRQVRRMIDHTGKSVIKLKRTRIGALVLGDLPLGTYRHLNADEVKALQEAAQGTEGRVDSAMVPGATVSIPSGPGGARRQLTFIEGPKEKKKPQKAAPPRRTTERFAARGSSDSRIPRGPASKERAGTGSADRPAQRGTRPEGRKPWPAKRPDRTSFGGRADRPEGRKPWQEKRPERTSFSRPEGAPVGRGARRGEDFKPRSGQGRPFGSRPATQDRRGPRPEGKRPWQSKRSESAGAPFHRTEGSSGGRGARTGEGFRPREGRGSSFNNRTASSGQRGARPEGNRPWTDRRSVGAPPKGRQGSSIGRSARTGEQFKPREGQARTFGAGPASRDQRAARRPEGKRPWQAERPAGRPGGAGSRPRSGGSRTSGPKTGWARPGNDRDKKGRGPRKRS